MSVATHLGSFLLNIPVGRSITDLSAEAGLTAYNFTTHPAT